MKRLLILITILSFATIANAKKIKIKIVSCNAAPINPIACPHPQSWVTPTNNCWVTPTGQMWFIP
jgi:hypothetical protein